MRNNFLIKKLLNKIHANIEAFLNNSMIS